MLNPINKLKNRVLNKNKLKDNTSLTNILDLARNFGCLGDIMGRTFEVKDKNNVLVYSVIQKPIYLSQLNVFLDELHKLKVIDAENENAKFGGKKK